jgi:uncharacterized membrane protein YfcA
VWLGTWQTRFGKRSSIWCRLRYFSNVGVLNAVLWGILGGAIAGLLTVSAAITASGFRWPWRGNDDGIWPRVFVFAVGIVVGGGVAAAAHSQMTGPWPAFIMGVCGPAVVRTALSRVEVAERRPAEVTISAEVPIAGENSANTV